MSENDITIFRSSYFRVYYYQGNIFQPLSIDPKYIGRVRRSIRDFQKQNSALIERDRSYSNYKTVLELFDEQDKEFGS